MTAVCPQGHSSSADDYCDVCGAPIDQSAPAAASAPAPTGAGAPGGGQECPHCGTANVAEALFCENCGYDFTTGTPPRSEQPPSETAADPVLGQDQPTGGSAATTPPGPDRVDPDQTAVRPVPVAGDSASLSPNLPFRWVAEVWIDPAWYEAQDSPDPLPSPGLPEVVPLRRTSLLIGRESQSRNIHPEIDCGTDSGVSRRQAQLTSDGTRWFVEDLDSANGTFVGSATGALPRDPVAVGTKAELRDDDRIYVGAWTRLVIREATEDELGSL